MYHVTGYKNVFRYYGIFTTIYFKYSLYSKLFFRRVKTTLLKNKTKIENNEIFQVNRRYHP